MLVLEVSTQLLKDYINMAILLFEKWLKMAKKTKKIYSITPEGKKKAFLEWLEIPINPAAAKFDYMAKIFFYDHLEEKKAVSLVEKFLADIRLLKKTQLESTEGVISQISDYYEMSVFNVGNAYYDFLITWYEKKFLAELKEKK